MPGLEASHPATRGHSEAVSGCDILRRVALGLRAIARIAMTGKMCKNSGLGDVDVPAHLFQCRHAEM